MKISIRLSILLVLLTANVPHVLAEIRLAGIFADNMVLQRDQPIRIWGWADIGEEVTVEFAEHSAKTTADEDGAWSVTLTPLAADDRAVLDDFVAPEIEDDHAILRYGRRPGVWIGHRVICFLR